jgi:hypothetical protein
MQETTETTEAKAEAEQLAALGRAWDEFAALAGQILEQESAAEGTDRTAGVLRAAAMVGRAVQGSQGLLPLMLARARECGKVPGGLDAWIATHLDVTSWTARGMVERAKVLGSVPQISTSLASGTVGRARSAR